MKVWLFGNKIWRNERVARVLFVFNYFNLICYLVQFILNCSLPFSFVYRPLNKEPDPVNREVTAQACWQMVAKQTDLRLYLFDFFVTVGSALSWPLLSLWLLPPTLVFLSPPPTARWANGQTGPTLFRTELLQNRPMTRPVWVGWITTN